MVWGGGYNAPLMREYTSSADILFVRHVDAQSVYEDGKASRVTHARQADQTGGPRCDETFESRRNVLLWSFPSEVSGSVSDTFYLIFSKASFTSHVVPVPGRQGRGGGNGLILGHRPRGEPRRDAFRGPCHHGRTNHIPV